MKQKRWTGVFLLLLAAAFLFVPHVSAEENTHREHTACKEIRTQEELMQMQSGGSYYLGNDVALSETVVIDGAVTLCLNGKVLQYENETGSVFHIEKEGVLQIFDCSEDMHTFVRDKNGLWTHTDGEGEKLTGGAVIGGKGEKRELAEWEIEYSYGGFAYLDGGLLCIYGGNFVGNGADYGGAVCINGDGRMEMYGGRFCGNLASVRGGGIFVQKGKLLLKNGSVSENRAARNGGGIEVGTEGVFEMRGGFVTGNEAQTGSGGIENLGKFDMYGGTVSENSATEDAGGVYNGGTFTMHGGSIRENSAEYGGGVCNDSKMTLHDGTVLSNLAQKSGGGIYNADTLVINGGTVASNTAATSGGGIENDGICTMYGGTVGGSTASDANAANLGGGVCVYSGSFIMYGGSIERNTGVDGGGVENEALFSMQGGTVSYNYAAYQGGGITNRGELILGGEATVVSNASGGEEQTCAGGIYWIAEENSSVSVSGSVGVTENTTGGRDANLVIYGDGTVSVSDASSDMRIGLTLLDRNGEAQSGAAVRFASADGAEIADTLFFSDEGAFVLRVKNGELYLHEGNSALVFGACLAAVVLSVLTVFLVIRKRRTAGFKKSV